MVASNPLFGGGYVNTSWPQAVVGSRYDQNLFWNDNGLFGYMFYYGWLGVFFIVCLYLYMFHKAFVIYRKTKSFALVGYLLKTALGFYTLFTLGMNASLDFPIVLGLLYMAQKEAETVKVFNKTSTAVKYTTHPGYLRRRLATY